MGALTPNYDNVTKVTIIPRSNGAGGFTLFTPSEERSESGLYSKQYLMSQLSVALGGRVAEEIVYGEDGITTGASGDLQQVRNLARRMVTQWGFKNQTSINDVPCAWEEPNPPSFGASRMISSDTETMIDTEITALVKQAYEHCKKTLLENRYVLDEVVKELIKYETINGTELHTIIDTCNTCNTNDGIESIDPDFKGDYFDV